MEYTGGRGGKATLDLPWQGPAYLWWWGGGGRGKKLLAQTRGRGVSYETGTCCPWPELRRTTLPGDVGSTKDGVCTLGFSGSPREGECRAETLRVTRSASENNGREDGRQLTGLPLHAGTSEAHVGDPQRAPFRTVARP